MSHGNGCGFHRNKEGRERKSRLGQVCGTAVSYAADGGGMTVDARVLVKLFCPL